MGEVTGKDKEGKDVWEVGRESWESTLLGTLLS